MSRVLASIAAWAVLWTCAAFAEDRTAVGTSIEEMLRTVPQRVVPASFGLIRVEYGNPDVFRPVVAESIAQGLSPLGSEALAEIRALAPDIGRDFLIVPPARMRLAIGIDHLDFGPNLMISDGRERLFIMRLGASAQAEMATALTARGFTQDRRLSQDVFWWLTDDNSADRTRRTRDNPFGGAQGSASRFMLMEGQIAWSPAWLPLDVLALNAPPRLADLPPIAPLLAGLEAGYDGPGGVGYVDLYAGVAGASSSPVDLTRTVLGEDTTRPKDLITGVLLADIAQMDREIAVLVLAFADGTDVAALADVIAANWTGAYSRFARGTYASLFSSAPQIIAVTDPGPAIAVVLTDDWDIDGAYRNYAFLRLHTMVGSSDLGALLEE